MGLGVLIQGIIQLKENTPMDVIDQLLGDIGGVDIDDYPVRRYPNYKRWANETPLIHISFIEDSRTIRFLILNVDGDIWDGDFEEMLSEYKQYIKGDSDTSNTNIDFYSLAEPGAFVNYGTIPDPEPKGDGNDGE